VPCQCVVPMHATTDVIVICPLGSVLVYLAPPSGVSSNVRSCCSPHACTLEESPTRSGRPVAIVTPSMVSVAPLSGEYVTDIVGRGGGAFMFALGVIGSASVSVVAAVVGSAALDAATRAIISAIQVLARRAIVSNDAPAASHRCMGSNRTHSGDADWSISTL
jgi:hypothetical protein